MASGYIIDEQFGKIIIRTRKGMRRTNARWVNGVLEMHFPEGVSEKNIRTTLDSMREGIERLRTKAAKRVVTYHEGQIINTFRHSIILRHHNLPRNIVRYGANPNNTLELYVELPPTANFDAPSATKIISACLKELMHKRAEEFLIPFAEKVASEKNAKPKSFIIGRGMRKLGHCTREGIIQLSYNLMFYPEELVKYVICHELAHLVEFNHSPQFHAVCNRLCDNREKQLEKALKSFILPILK